MQGAAGYVFALQAWACSGAAHPLGAGAVYPEDAPAPEAARPARAT